MVTRPGGRRYFMAAFAHSSPGRLVAAIVIVCVGALNAPVAVKATGDTAVEDLKQILYKYYFRGRYEETIDALVTFLAREDIDRELAVSAREFVAASYVLSGNPSGGRDQFLRLLNENQNYTGPDPAVFKTEVIDAFTATRDAWIAAKMRTAPDTTGESEIPTAVATESRSPIYKKWWFYAGIAAAAAIVAFAAAPGGDDGSAAPAPTGTIAVGVRIQ